MATAWKQGLKKREDLWLCLWVYEGENGPLQRGGPRSKGQWGAVADGEFEMVIYCSSRWGWGVTQLGGHVWSSRAESCWREGVCSTDLVL